MDKNCAAPKRFFFLLPSPERHWRFVTRSYERKRPSAPTRERSPPHTKPGTAADVRAADTHAHTHRNAHTHNRKKEALALRFGKHRDREVCSETTQSTARRLGEAHSSDTTVPPPHQHGTSHRLDCPGRLFSLQNITAGLQMLMLLFWDDALTATSRVARRPRGDLESSCGREFVKGVRACAKTFVLFYTRHPRPPTMTATA